VVPLKVEDPELPVVVREMLFCFTADRLSTAFCTLGLVAKTFVSALTDPVDVIVEKFIPVPADTDSTVPPPELAIKLTTLSIPFWRQALVDRDRVSAFTVPFVVIVGKFIPTPAATEVTVPEPPPEIVQERSAERSRAVPFMVSVLDVGTPPSPERV
jgi:hypothetical protein